jgi:soluble lytic murein transglycosylase-like protein
VLASEVAPQFETRAPSAIQDQVDDVVVAEMQVRRLVVMPGESATFEVSVANHGRWSALFEVSLEGWIDEAWTPDLPIRVQLEAGARQAVIVPIALPRQPDCRAGDHALAVVVRAARYPGRVTRLAATLVIERFASLKLGTPQPHEVDLSWFVPAATMRLPVTNQSNYPATIHLQGMDRERHCDFTFYTDGNSPDGNNIDDGIMGSARLVLQPGQTVSIPVEIRTRHRPLMGIMPRIVTFRMVARMDTEPPLRRAVEGELAVSALIGPWQMAIAGVLGVVAVFGIGLAGLALLVALRSTAASAPVPQVAPTSVPVAPVVAFVIQMDQQMPTREPSLPVNALPAPNEAQEVLQGAPQQSNEAPQIPIVGADQVTAPGEPTPVGQRPLRPLAVTTPGAAGASVAAVTPPQANGANLTYGEMFKDVASQFDLDWRLLAAQAYLESGFDSLALSGQGDMGLMQIRPGTWNEWAPTVEASDPFDSYSNVLVGAAYLNHLREQLSTRGFPQQEWMLVAYNWGPDKVFDHLDAGGTWESLELERRQYADDILRIAASIPPS